MQREHLRIARDWLDRHRIPGEGTGATISPDRDSVPSESDADSEVEIEIREEQEGQTRFVEPGDRQITGGQSRYARFAAKLHEVDSDTQKLSIAFGEIEALMQAELPPSARRHASWWSNDTTSHPQSIEWLDAGWRVAGVDLNAEQVDFTRIPWRESAYRTFFDSFLNRLRREAPHLARGRRAAGRHWVTILSLPPGGPPVGAIGCSFTRRHELRVELYLDMGDRDDTKAIFDSLAEQCGAIEEAFGEPLEWERLDERRASRIAVYKSGDIGLPSGELEQLQMWAVERVIRLTQVTEPAVKEALLARDRQPSS